MLYFISAYALVCLFFACLLIRVTATERGWSYRHAAQYWLDQWSIFTPIGLALLPLFCIVIAIGEAIAAARDNFK